jgi:hypothetical protein
MVSIMEEFEVLGLRSEVAIVTKPLPSEESLIVAIIEALHDSITPRFSYRDKDHFDPQKQTEPEDDAKGTRVTIASPKAEFVVDLEEIWNPHGLPATDQAQGHGLIVFGSLGMEKDAVTVEIHDIERIETSISLDISGSKEVRLLDIVESQGLCEIGIFDSFGGIRSFF